MREGVVFSRNKLLIGYLIPRGQPYTCRLHELKGLSGLYIYMLILAFVYVTRMVKVGCGCERRVDMFWRYRKNYDGENDIVIIQFLKILKPK